jgi:hypothetical protein
MYVSKYDSASDLVEFCDEGIGIGVTGGVCNEFSVNEW